MALVALITWMLTALGGLYMLATWLIEYESADQAGGAGRRLRAPLIFIHALLAVSGLVLWILYLILDQERLAWYSLFVLLAVASLGFTMLGTWIGVYRGARTARLAPRELNVAAAEPAEQHFPLAVVLGHGLLAAVTIAIVGWEVLAAGSGLMRTRPGRPTRSAAPEPAG